MQDNGFVRALATELGQPFGIHAWDGFMDRAAKIVASLTTKGWRTVRVSPGMTVPEFVGALALSTQEPDWRTFPEATVVQIVLGALVADGWQIRHEDGSVWMPDGDGNV